MKTYFFCRVFVVVVVIVVVVVVVVLLCDLCDGCGGQHLVNLKNYLLRLVVL
jgi:hypothetical protein